MEIIITNHFLRRLEERFKLRPDESKNFLATVLSNCSTNFKDTYRAKISNTDQDIVIAGILTKNSYTAITCYSMSESIRNSSFFHEKATPKDLFACSKIYYLDQNGKRGK